MSKKFKSLLLKIHKYKFEEQKSILEKNTIIPYVEKLDTWYRTCDGQFVSSKVANEISTELVLEFVNSVDKSVNALSKQIETMNEKLTSGLLIGKVS